MLSTKKLVGIGGVALVAAAATATALLVPGASAGTRAPTTITMTIPTGNVAGTPFTIGFTVTSPGGTPTGRVVLYGPVAPLCHTTLNPATGTGSCTLTIPGGGTIPLQARYQGSLSFLPAIATGSVTVSGGGVSGAP